MLINVSEGEECRIALLEDGKLEELYMERTSSTSHVGNIYKGRVTNVEPSIQAAFVDFGMGRNGFLHISDLLPQYFGRKGEDVQEAVGRKMARRDRPPIQRCLRRGDEIIVQIIKEGIGTKGPTLSTYLSIPGRILVMMPGMSKMGVSRKIEDEPERRRLRQILDSLKPPEDVGFIIRTAGVGKTKADIERDFKFLTRLWDQIEKVRKSTPAPVELYTEGDLVTRTVRDVYASDVDRIIVDSKDVAARVKDFIKISAPRTRNRLELYEEPIPLFHKYGIEHEIELMHSRYVPLSSGGSLVIDSTEAVVAIDVNSGKFREHSDAEMTAFKTDMEAADEICRQLKLRDLGGVIICDFIDLRYERHRRELERRIHDNFKKDRAKTKVLRMSEFGIIEMTRQRMRPSLKRSVYFDCPHCKGHGLVKTPESMSLDVMRKLAIAINDARVARVEVSVCADIAFYLQNRKRGSIANLEAAAKKRVIVRVDPQLALDEVRFDLYDLREGLVTLDALGVMPSDQALQKADPRIRQQQQQHAQRPGRQRHRPLPRPAEAEASANDLFDDEESPHHDAGGDQGSDARRRDSVAAGAESAGRGGENDESHEHADVNGQAGEGGTRRRRRRRRGGRGRRRGQGNDLHASDAQAVEGELHPDAGQLFSAEYDSHDDDDEIGAAPSEISDERDLVEITHRPEAAEESARAMAAAPEEAFRLETEEPIPGNEADALHDSEQLKEDAETPREEPKAEEGADAEPEKKRRRGRRGGRSRGKKPEVEATAAEADAPAEPAPADEPPVSVEEAPESPEAPGQSAAEAVAEKPKPARRSRARTKPVRRPPAAKTDGAEPANGSKTGKPAPAASRKTDEGKSSGPKVIIAAKPVAPSRQVIPPLPTQRTGSADRHLVDDDDATPARPASRPRSYRDLDAIPDDFD